MQETEISQWEESDFFLEIDFSHEWNIKSLNQQLPYANEANFWRDMVKALVSDHL